MYSSFIINNNLQKNFMLISCPNCKTTFAIPAKAIGTTGRKVKCSKCAHVWLQEPIQIDKEQFNNLLKVEYSESSTMPVRYKRPKFNYIYLGLIIALIISVGVLEVFKNPDEYPSIAEQLDLPDYEGLRFHNFRVVSEISDNKLNFHLKGTIINTTDKKARIPVIDVKIYSKGGRIMAKNQVAIPKEYIGPYERLNITPELLGVSGNAEQIELSFENWLESSLR